MLQNLQKVLKNAPSILAQLHKISHLFNSYGIREGPFDFYKFFDFCEISRKKNFRNFEKKFCQKNLLKSKNFRENQNESLK